MGQCEGNMHLNVHVNTCINVCPMVKDATVIFCALNHLSILPLWVRVQLGSRETIQVLLAGGWVFFLGDLPFSPNHTIDLAQNEWSNLDECKTQMKKNVCGFYDVLCHVEIPVFCIWMIWVYSVFEWSECFFLQQVCCCFCFTGKEPIYKSCTADPARYYEPHHEKTCLRCLWPGKTQTGLLSYRD